MGRWSRGLAPLFVRFAGVRDGDTVLDVGSGTGALAASVAKIAPSSRIVGIDPAAPYVALAQSQHGSPLLHFDVGDAQQMRFENGTFDRTLSLLVLMHSRAWAVRGRLP
jgi:ubiquinone/menaquinone biosynthesis C-methylase UbiE